MVEELKKEPRVRLFVALDLPDELRRGIADWGAGELRDPALRPVADESLHITLAFLGHRDTEEVEPIEAVLAASVGSAPRVELLQPAPRPPRGRARLYALPVRSEGAAELQATLAGNLAAASLYDPEKRPFWPHVTLARVRSEGKGSRRPLVVAKPPKSFPVELSQPCFCRRMTLYRSVLQSRGARYVPLAQVELPIEGGSEVI
jgi:RNA 2',3'-cyclic 3'-phosphodiesterase